MQFLANILGQIDGSKSAASAPSAPGQPTSGASQKAVDGTSNGTGPSKRKAETDLPNATSKLPRKDNTSLGQTKSASAHLPARTAQSGNVKPQPYRGTAGTGTGIATGAARPPSKPPLKTAALSKATSSPASAAPVTDKAPAKGSYAEILARGKASQPKDIMQIANKKALEPTLQRGRDRKKMMEKGRFGGSDREVQSAGEGSEATEQKKKPIGYRGNARASSAAPATDSARPAYAGTAGLKHGGASGGQAGSAGKKEKERYTGYDSGDEDDEEDYDSDGSSDMEANVFDVDQEEEFSARAARKEDADELAKLSELDRQKRQRKMMLEKMAEEKRNKKRVL